MSCRSIGAYKTALQQECTLLEVTWLSPGDQLCLASLKKKTREGGFQPAPQETSPAGVPPPAGGDHIPKVEHTSPPNAALPLRRSRRPPPSGGDASGLTTTDVIWSPDRSAMALRFTRSKTCLTGPGFLVQLRDHPTINAVSFLMSEWWEMMGLRTARTVTLFPKRLSASRCDWSSPISYDSLVTRIK